MMYRPFEGLEGLEAIRNKGVGYLFIKSRAIRDSSGLLPSSSCLLQLEGLFQKLDTKIPTRSVRYSVKVTIAKCGTARVLVEYRLVSHLTVDRRGLADRAEYYYCKSTVQGERGHNHTLLPVVRVFW